MVGARDEGWNVSSRELSPESASPMIAACNAGNIFVIAVCSLSAAFSLRDAQRRRPTRSSGVAVKCNGSTLPTEG